MFWAVTIAAAASMVLLATSLPESRPPEQRIGRSWAGALGGDRRLLADRHFMGLVFIGAFGISSFFAYLAHSSFVLIGHYGLTPRQYSIAFSVNAASFIGVSQFTGKLGLRFGMRRLVSVAVVGYAVTLVLLLALALAGLQQLWLMVALLLVAYGFLGLVVPTSAVLALEEHGEIAGTASALMGTLQFVTGAVVIAVSGLFLDGTPGPMLASIAVCAVLACAMARFTLGSGRTPPAVA